MDIGSCSKSEYDTASLILNSTATAQQLCRSLNVQALGGITNAVVAFTVQQLHSTATKLATTQNATLAALVETSYGLNTTFVLFGAFSVFFMQAGFAMFVAGVVRAKNISSVLLKSAIGSVVSAICFYLLGYGFVHGQSHSPNAFIGDADFALSSTDQSPVDRQLFLWNWVFCAASTTMMVGAVAERATLHSYFMYCMFYVFWVYPVNAHWYWSPNGWLSPSYSGAILGMGVIDFAGSGVVHTMGGFASLMGCIVLGPRFGRFDNRGVHAHEYKQGHSPPMFLLGTFLLWYGWYSFNAVSVLSINTIAAAQTVARISTCTTLSGAAAGITTMLLVFYRTKTWNMLSICTGTLGGMVAITAGCSVVEPWAAIICGIVAAPCVVYGEVLLEWFKIDDPGCAFSIHGISGIWGVMFVGLLAKETYVVTVYGKPADQGFMGIFYGGHGQLLLCQFIAVLVTVAWVCFWMYAFFWVLNRFNLLRVRLEEEALGLDTAAMGDHSIVTVAIKDTKTPDASMHVVRAAFQRASNSQALMGNGDLYQSMLQRQHTSGIALLQEGSGRGTDHSKRFPEQQGQQQRATGSSGLGVQGNESAQQRRLPQRSFSVGPKEVKVEVDPPLMEAVPGLHPGEAGIRQRHSLDVA